MEKKNIHMIGIGGIGISSLAQLYIHLGHCVSGTNDNQSPQTLDRIRALGVKISIGTTISDIPVNTDFFVYSDAWLTTAPEFLDDIRALGKPMLSYFEALGEATKNGVSIVVSGTHGKTTTTAMIAKILIDAGKEPTVIAGSILSEYGSNFVAGKKELFVIEGCEYRRHFLNLHPDVLVITNIELDHTDYYRDLADMQDAFRSVVGRVPTTGAVVTNTSSETIIPVVSGSVAPVVPYQGISVPKLLTPGEFNRENARAAKGAVQALFTDIDESVIDTALAGFTGTWRRFEYKGVTHKGAVVYDDYAHHPTAVERTIAMAKEEFPDKKIVVVFHPHLYSRTKSFFTEFAAALALAHETILIPIFAAREEPDPTVDSASLAHAVTEAGGVGKYADSFDVAKDILEEKNADTVIITMGAGDVYQVGDQIVEA
jgi:UDP-N-acetylmuramate--alanine ligase